MKTKRLLLTIGLLVSPLLASCEASDEVFSSSTTSYDVSFPSSLLEEEYMDAFKANMERVRYQIEYDFANVLKSNSTATRPITITPIPKPTRNNQDGNIFVQNNHMIMSKDSSNKNGEYSEIINEDDVNNLYSVNYVDNLEGQLTFKKKVDYDKFYLKSIFFKLFSDDIYSSIINYDPTKYVFDIDSNDEKYLFLTDIKAKDLSQGVEAKFNVLIFFNGDKIRQIKFVAPEQSVGVKAKADSTFSATYVLTIKSFDTILDRPSGISL